MVNLAPAKPAAVLDSEVLKERLITKEGHSLVPTRGSLSKCALRFREFTQASLRSSSSAPGAARDEQISKLKAAKKGLETELQLHNLEMRKLALSSQVAELELAHYRKIAESTQTSIVSSKKEIEGLKAELVREKKVRKNREEYDSLAKMASARPSSRSSKRKLEAIRGEIEQIRSEDSRAQKELEVKGKQFQLLMQSIHDLKSILNEDEARAIMKKDDA